MDFFFAITPFKYSIFNPYLSNKMFSDSNMFHLKQRAVMPKVIEIWFASETYYPMSEEYILTPWL